MQTLPFYWSLVLILGSVGCGGTDDQSSGTTAIGSGGANPSGGAPASGGNSNTSANTAFGGSSVLGGGGGSAPRSSSLGGSGNASEPPASHWNDGVTANCTSWPRGKVQPKTGPFFYGPDPGPCRIGTTTGFIDGTEYAYDANGRVQTFGNFGRLVRYNYQDDLIASFTIGGSEAIDATLSYEDDTIVARRASEDARFELDPRGYPRRATYDVNHDGAPDWGRLYQYEGCKLVRVILDPDLPAPPSTTTVSGSTYEYDEVGHVKAIRADSGSVETYDYACWQ